jgi:hypothetical protein
MAEEEGEERAAAVLAEAGLLVQVLSRVGTANTEHHSVAELHLLEGSKQDNYT